MDDGPYYPGHSNTILECDFFKFNPDSDRDKYMYCREILFYHAMVNEKNEFLGPLN